MVDVKLSQLVFPASSMELHKQQILFSQELNSKIKGTVEEVAKSIEKLNIQDENVKQALFLQCNNFVEHLSNIIYNLRNFVGNLQEKLIGKQDLIKLTEKMVETSHAVQHSFSKDSKDLQLKLIKSVQDVNVEAADLLKIIENETSHEIKKKLIDELSNLLRAIDCIKFHVVFINSTVGKIKVLFDECAKRIQISLDNLKNDSNNIVCYHLIHSTNAGCQHMEKVVHYLETYADQCDAKIHKVMASTAIDLHNLVAKIQECLYTSVEIKSLRDVIRENVTNGAELIGELENFLQNKEVTESVRQIVYVVCSNSLASGDQLHRGLENLSRFKKLV